jgi:AcrR family transcriptional regulator
MKKPEATRERILKAAFELISSRGYLGSSTREIALLAQVAEVTLFRQFANKESLFAEVLRTFSSLPTLSELVPRLRSLPLHESITTLTRCFLAHLDTNRNWIKILCFEVDHAPVELKDIHGDFLKQVFKVLTDFFTDARERGEINPDLNPEHVARAFHSMVFGYHHIEGMCGNKSELATHYDAIIESFVNIFCRGIHAQN